MQSHCWSKLSQGDGSVNSVGSQTMTGGTIYGNIFMMAQNVVSKGKVMWLVDSGCSSHMAGRKEFFHQLNESIRQRVRMGDDSALEVQGKGVLQFKCLMEEED